VALVIAAVALLGTACGGDATQDGPQTVRLVTHDSFLVSDGTLEAFEAETGHTVELLQAGDAGTMVNQAILTKDNPTADVMFGVDTTFVGRALDEGIFLPHVSNRLDVVDDAIEIDERVTPIDIGDVCINYDIAGLAEEGIPAPRGLEDLADGRFAGRVVVQNPATSSPGLAFLLSTIAEFGEDGDRTWQDFWRDLVTNDVLVTSGWEDAYYGEFSGGAGEGSRPVVVSYASSPPAEVIFADPRPAEAPTAVVTDSCFRQVEYAGVLSGTEVPEAAAALVDFMLSPTFQNDIPLNMFVFPAASDAELPTEFVEFTQLPNEPLSLDPNEIDANRDRWIDEWTSIVLP
jgi:thiamine transport system substrate-binding protein